MSAARRTRVSGGRPVGAPAAWSAGATFGRVAVIGGLAYWRSGDGAKGA